MTAMRDEASQRVGTSRRNGKNKQQYDDGCEGNEYKARWLLLQSQVHLRKTHDEQRHETRLGSSAAKDGTVEPQGEEGKRQELGSKRSAARQLVQFGNPSVLHIAHGKE